MRKMTGGMLWVLLILGGCSSSSALKDTLPRIPPDYSYRKQAIDLHLKADPQLNLFHRTPHTLLLCIYHLRDPNPSNRLRDEHDGLQRLLDCGRFGPSVVYSRRLVIQPGQELRESLDRPEGTRQVAVAAGPSTGGSPPTRHPTGPASSPMPASCCTWPGASTY
jgi:type VI secretion system VasD/TssJ family lipoprotein